METFKKFKTELSDFYKDKFGDTLAITSKEPIGDDEAIETELNGEKFYTFSLKVMKSNWQRISLIEDVDYIEYVATTLYKNTSK